MKSAVYEGRVRHRRFGEPEHAFEYAVGMLYLDLAELDRVFRGRWLWSHGGFAPFSFSRKGHLGDPGRPLSACVRDLVEQRTGARPAGPIRLLTHPRVFGFVFNPVSFYYVFDARDERVETIVVEINNTPWKEQHCYVLTEAQNEGDCESRRFRFAKEFHVSPFLGMDHRYEWAFGPPGERLGVSMKNLRAGECVFDAVLNLSRRQLDGRSLAGLCARFPLATVRVLAAIYWQALRLRLAGAPFHEHPGLAAVAQRRPDAETSP